MFFSSVAIDEIKSKMIRKFRPFECILLTVEFGCVSHLNIVKCIISFDSFKKLVPNSRSRLVNIGYYNLQSFI